MIKLALIITGLQSDGAETMLLKLLQHIDRKRFNPVVVSLTTAGEIGPRISALGVQVVVLGMRAGVPSLLKFIKLVRLLRYLQPEVVHTWMYHSDLLGGLAARMVGVKAIAWGIRHSNLSHNKNKCSTLLVMKICAKLSNWLPRKILTCSERAQNIHVAVGYCSKKFLFIPNGFDLKRFIPDISACESVRYELGLPQDMPLVGLIARDNPQKNHMGFIEAAIHLHHQLPKVHFLLVGKGIDEYNQSLMRAISEAGMQDYFHLLGRRDDIPRLMASLDVLASSSWGEAFPNVLGEAMACGVPCVVTDVGDSAEIVGDTGRVVQAGDMLGLANAMRDLLKMSANERAILSMAVRERVASLFEIGATVKRYEAFYESLISEVGKE